MTRYVDPSRAGSNIDHRYSAVFLQLRNQFQHEASNRSIAGGRVMTSILRVKPEHTGVFYAAYACVLPIRPIHQRTLRSIAAERSMPSRCRLTETAVGPARTRTASAIEGCLRQAGGSWSFGDCLHFLGCHCGCEQSALFSSRRTLLPDTKRYQTFCRFKC